jgi:XTP/dITP diphosphohydrolase
VRRGETSGRILTAPRGSGGFGYDPYFESVELSGRTFAEASVGEKEAVSHRGRAFHALLDALRTVGTRG